MSSANLKIQEQKYRAFTFGSLSVLGNTTLENLVEIFNRESGVKPDRLAGRAVPRFASIPETGPVIIKFYKRGGFISRIVEQRYFRWFKTRSRREFEFLLRAEKAGVTVPSPVAYASRGALFYRAWLVLKEIPHHVSFARLCAGERERAITLMPEVSDNIRLLIQSGIHHVDLHPGNILVDKDNRPYIIDFDKARYCLSGRAVLAEKYKRRWARAVRKHNLPDVFIDLPLTADNAGSP